MSEEVQQPEQVQEQPAALTKETAIEKALAIALLYRCRQALLGNYRAHPRRQFAEGCSLSKGR